MRRNVRSIAASIILSSLLFSLSACASNDSESGGVPLQSKGASAAPASEGRPATPAPEASKERECGNYKGRQLYRGPDGGCYYYTKSGGKKYIERKICDC